MKLAGRTALVTGASRGIGRAIARAYVADGARVVVTGRDAGALDALVAELGNAAHAVPGDLAAPETPDSLVAATLAHFGADMSHVVEQRVYVTNIDEASAALEVRKSAYGGKNLPASTMVKVSKLVMPQLKCEVAVVARLDR